MEENYFDERNKKNTLKLRELREQLPPMCSEFFVGVENRTTPLTRLGYAQDLRVFFAYLLTNVKLFKGISISDFGFRELELVNQSHIEGFLEYLSYYKFGGKEYSNDERGKSRKLSSVRSFFKYFFNKGKISSNVASKVATPKMHDKEIIRLEVDEVAKLLDAVEDGNKLTERQQSYHEHTKLRDLAMITLLLGTGIRVSECVGLNISDLDFKNSAFTVTRKGGNRTILYFSDEVALSLRQYLQDDRLMVETDSDALFLSLQKKRMTVRAAELIVKKYSKIVTPLKKITPHKLRSTFGTNLYHETQDIYVVAEVLGHKDVNTTKKHYAATSDEIKRNAARVTILRDKTPIIDPSTEDNN